MSLIIQIDTAAENASASIAENGVVIAAQYNDAQKDHAAFLQPAIQQLLIQCGKKITDADAVAVTAGPGSYTGLRVGMSGAKGICYALQKPLITLNTLQVLAYSVMMQNNYATDVLLCPMIDARRMEVFTALYNTKLEEQSAPCAMILDDSSYGAFLQHNSIIFCGNGSIKWKNICAHHNAQFEKMGNIPAAVAVLAQKQFELEQFADLAYSEPFYIKGFHDKA
ncbi:MAG: tRNA (adenosine(37)-N6)-threonylcarbamoyltransferase complex dimerization subunit type 1 TsaB [Bacteroidetes bacterium]|nr:tRNA (adenosine(37)-N6)-threonylcarbamoyltransferase complex dimerization subunit type 1 TsaB [Bacteroidota bacterium]